MNGPILVTWTRSKGRSFYPHSKLGQVRKSKIGFVFKFLQRDLFQCIALYRPKYGLNGGGGEGGLMCHLRDLQNKHTKGVGNVPSN